MAAPFDRFIIAPFKTGLETDLKPWLIPEDAFEELDNAYVFRGRVRKRFGSMLTGYGAASSTTAPLYSRLRIALTGGGGVGITDGTGSATGTVPGTIFKIGQIFSIGTEIFTVVETGTPGTMITTGSATTMTFDTTSGAYVFAGAAINTQIYFYTAEPVMGLTQHESSTINNSPALAFDTQFVYKYIGGYWNLIGPTADQWHGDNKDFFWCTNWTGINADDTYLFATNFQAAIGIPDADDDPMWYYNGTTWTSFSPKFLIAGAGNKVLTAKIIIPFKDRLLFLNTIEQNEGNTENLSYVNRCRFSHNGSPLAASAWYEPNEVGATGAGWIDAATEEQIISAEFIKDRLIVYFERSTWELAYTGNQIQPFVWQKINTELGSESMKSTVPFDKIVLTVGTRGIHACSGANVERIDQKIPNKIFQIRNSNNGVDRVAGIRDYYTEMVYWTFPTNNSNASSETYPNKVLVYNYKNGTWGFNDDCITAFGYFEQQEGTTWASTYLTWKETDFAWGDGVTQPEFRQIIAGNHQGFVFIISPELSSNAPAMQITNMIYDATPSTIDITVIDHTLNNDEYIKIENATGLTISGDGIYQVAVIDSDTIRITVDSCSGTYVGGGTAARVSNINILSKQWNVYLPSNHTIYLAQIDFIVQKTSNGEVTVDYYPSSSGLSMIDEGTATESLLGTNVLETYSYETDSFEETQERLKHRVYFQGEGECVQIRIYLSKDQMMDPDIAESDFELQGMILYTLKTGN